MTIQYHIAYEVVKNLPATADRYDQIAEIKRQFIKADNEILATCRESIDNVLDILFYEYAFNA